MTKKKFKKECKNCGKKFTAMNVRKIFCRRVCAESFHAKKRLVSRVKIKKVCKECKKKFSTENKLKMFCSDNCQQRSSRAKEATIEKKCVFCKRVFFSGKKTARFCSNSCSAKNFARFEDTGKSTCPICKMSFDKRKRKNHTFCSKKCKNKNRKKMLVGCDFCGNRFERRVDSVGQHKNIFCSHKCNGLWNTEKGVRLGKKSPRYDHSFLEKDRSISCKKCGKPIRISKSEKNTKKYCSRKCKVGGMGKTMTSPHRKTVEILRKNRIWNRSEHKVGRYLLDCYLGKGLAIEVQGRYWHGDIRFFKRPKNKMQEKIDIKDRRKKNLLGDKGITVLYIWEDDIENDPKMCEKLILRFKERNGILSNYHSMNYHTMGRSVALNRNILIPRFEL